MQILKVIKPSIFDNTIIRKKWFEEEHKYSETYNYFGSHDDHNFPHFIYYFPLDSTYNAVFRVEPAEWETLKLRSEETPVLIGSYIKSNPDEEFYYFLYRGIYYRSEIEISENEVLMVLQTMWESKKEKLSHALERIKAKAEFEGNLRSPIPNEVQITVWNRDGGKCVKCGSSINLEFDHIIPVSMGGSNTARNIQLLCERCNRSKGANIGG